MPAVAVNVADVAPAGTVSEAGTGSAVVLLAASVTAPPPVGAAWLSVTVQVVATPEVMLVGAHASDDAPATGVTVTVAVVLPPRVAVTVTVCGVATVPADPVNVIEVAPAGTAMEAGTVSAAVLLDATATLAPPVGATWSTVTVHVVAAPDAMLVGTHASEDTAGFGVTTTVAAALPAKVAVTVTV